MTFVVTELLQPTVYAECFVVKTGERVDSRKIGGHSDVMWLCKGEWLVVIWQAEVKEEKEEELEV